ncbi:MAG: OmpA family protein, partial [Methylomarinum sp.]|nr:OmpA family protein [Methylomarinum sp.]
QSGDLLRFSIRDDVPSSKAVRASLTIDAPPWIHDTVASQDYLVSIEQSIESQKYSRLSVYGATAETMLGALAKGLFPRFDYVNSTVNGFSEEMHVAVSAVNFLTTYQQFIDCRKDFLPPGFKDALEQSLFFKSSSKQINNRILMRLKNIAKYIKEVKGSKVVVASDTLIAGTRDKKWFSSRANAIVSQLDRLGVPKDKVSIKQGLLAKQVNNKAIRLGVFGPDALKAIYYRKGNVNLTQTEMQRLDLVVRYMDEFLPNGKLIIKSYTDSKGKRAVNLKISQKRAEVVKRYLVSKGLAEKVVQVKAYGEDKPVKSNRFPIGRAQNRRVIIDFIG